MNSNHSHGDVYSIQHYVIKFVSDLQQISGFLLVLDHDHDGPYISKETINKYSLLYYDVSYLNGMSHHLVTHETE
jgi:hypothetical protein